MIHADDGTVSRVALHRCHEAGYVTGGVKEAEWFTELGNESTDLYSAWMIFCTANTYSDGPNGVKSVVVEPLVEISNIMGIREIRHSCQKLLGKHIELWFEVEDGVPLI